MNKCVAFLGTREISASPYTPKWRALLPDSQMQLLKSNIPCIVGIIAFALFPSGAHPKQVTLPSKETPSGYIALLLINEVPFPGDSTYISERNSKQAMTAIFAVLVNRLQHVPHPYTQDEVAGIRTRSILDIITVGGVGGQVEGFYKNDRGEYVVLPRVSRRVEHLLAIANQGTPGTFARLVEFAATVPKDYFEKNSSVEDMYANLRTVRQVPVTGRAYAWMTNIHHLNPGGNFIVVPTQDQGTLGGNRFFTLRKLAR